MYNFRLIIVKFLVLSVLGNFMCKFLLAFMCNQEFLRSFAQECSSVERLRGNIRKSSVKLIYIHITAASRAVWYIARACAGDIQYAPEGFSPRRTYFRIARRAHRARVLYDFSAREARLIWNISTRGSCF